MTPNNFREKANFIWQVADDILRGAFKAHEYGDMILPFVVLRRLDLVLEPQKDAVINADNPRDAKVYKFNQVLDRQLLEFVHTKLDLYKKLTEPKVNEMLKHQWFEVLAREMGDQDGI